MGAGLVRRGRPCRAKACACGVTGRCGRMTARAYTRGCAPEELRSIVAWFNSLLYSSTVVVARKALLALSLATQRGKTRA